MDGAVEENGRWGTKMKLLANSEKNSAWAHPGRSYRAAFCVVRWSYGALLEIRFISGTIQAAIFACRRGRWWACDGRCIVRHVGGVAGEN